MRAEFLVELPMLAFAEQMQIHLTHERAVLIRVSHDELRSVPTSQAQTVIKFARRARHPRLKKTVTMNFLRGQRLTIAHDVDLARVRPKDMDREIVSYPVRPEDAERIGMRAGEKAIQLIRRQTGHGKRFHDPSTSYLSSVMSSEVETSLNISVVDTLAKQKTV